MMNQDAQSIEVFYPTRCSTLVDVQDVPLAMLRTWRIKGLLGGKYIGNSSRVAHAGRLEYAMHRLIMECPPGMQVDHRNGNPCDNRRSNLRIATNAQNQWNRGPHLNSPRRHTHGVKGAIFDKHKHRKKWVARIKVNKKALYLGAYATPEEAGAAYAKAAAIHHGQFARTQ